jgi:sialate O-acetylesterase
VEGWTSREILETYSDVDLSEKAIEALNPMSRPLLMYNAMIKPLTNYTIKGFIWYQGESNVGRHDVYAQRLANMVKLWRNDWGLGELPFYYVEIAPFVYGDGETGTSAAYLREAQFKAQSIIPNSGMISTNDLVEKQEKRNIHPKNKTEVGRRLAYMALSQTYNMKNIASHGPEYKSMELKDGKIHLSFHHDDDGFNRMSGAKGFEIAGSDSVFVPADVQIDLNNRVIIVSHKEIPNPVAARYCFRNFQIGNMANTRELPMVPFRTDNF